MPRSAVSLLAWGAVALVVVALVVVLSRVALVVISSGPIPAVRSDAQIEGGDYVANLVLEHSEQARFVTVLSADRALATAAGLGVPAGFVATPMPASNASEREYVDTWNRDNVRYTGHLPLEPGATVQLRFPLANPAAPLPQVAGQFEHKRMIGGSIGFFHIQPPAVQP